MDEILVVVWGVGAPGRIEPFAGAGGVGALKNGLPVESNGSIVRLILSHAKGRLVQGLLKLAMVAYFPFVGVSQVHSTNA